VPVVCLRNRGMKVTSDVERHMQRKKNQKQTGATSNATHQSKQGHVADVLMMILAGDVWRWPRREQHPLHEDLFLIHCYNRPPRRRKPPPNPTANSPCSFRRPQPQPPWCPSLRWGTNNSTPRRFRRSPEDFIFVFWLGWLILRVRGGWGCYRLILS